MAGLVAAVDVGTGSARAGVFDDRGRLLGRAERPIETLVPEPGWAVQNSEAIWGAVCSAVRAARLEAAAEPASVRGVSFDATCSLVVRDRGGGPLAVQPGAAGSWDTILWMDHRATAEAEICTRSGHPALARSGGVMSPEMQVPKLMWLKRHLPATWARIGYLFDLTDFLTWRASGSLARSHCTMVSKWEFRPDSTPNWPTDFFAAMGLADMLRRGRLPDTASPIGSDLGSLTLGAADALGLHPAARVGVGLIDAHAGALGMLGGFAGDSSALTRNHAMVCGTSTCVMALSETPRHAPSLWGPHVGAVLPGLWVSEGGQSVSGALLDHILQVHSAGGAPTPALHARVCARVTDLLAGEGADLGGRLHVLPDFHGNRSPLADADAVGVISGLTLDRSFDGLCRLYWRTAVALALGVRHILDAMAAAGLASDTLHLVGGHTRNPLLPQLYADATGRAVWLSGSPDAVLLGTAMAAATAAGLHPDLAGAGRAMHQPGKSLSPNPALRGRFERDYRVFLKMHDQRRALDDLLWEPGAPPYARAEPVSGR